MKADLESTQEINKDILTLNIDYEYNAASINIPGCRFNEGKDDYVFEGEEGYEDSSESSDEESDDVDKKARQEEDGWAGEAVTVDEDTETTE